ncbi:macrolide ABC transporter ATP-binding protein [Pseudoclavibacter sp. RFBG4]|uniref:ABC transporter ATP-binding protein n=1 Tax=Pseudoclavibacter sp. RFBG4 TaxID=2080575 RepID=UPI000CE72638|nr:ABC transporter ATP-binding protein [Pseudoclavibacter sp. RFBG4]PPG26422.1 macrolide ABC transporter ATP-binding protein [Pseudoclavibacter sp. RFBG4]
MITTHDLTKTYGEGTSEVRANRGISLEIAAGEFVVLAGPSGSGKTTLLNLIGGLDTATSGSVTVNGAELTRLSPRELSDFRRDQIGYVFQKSNLVGSLSVYENAVLQLRVQGRLTRGAAARTRELLTAVGLGDKLTALPRQLSGGQQQRAAIIRAVTSGTAVVVADEPTASLDGPNADGVLDLLRLLNEQDGTTIVVSSHDDRVLAAGGRIVHLVDGRLAA